MGTYEPLTKHPALLGDLSGLMAHILRARGFGEGRTPVLYFPVLPNRSRFAGEVDVQDF
jgi:hypothetical protein